MNNKVLIKNENDTMELNMDTENFIANVSVNGNSFTTTFSDNIDIDRAAKELTKALVSERRKKSYSLGDLFPAFGREFKIRVSQILKMREGAL